MDARDPHLRHVVRVLLISRALRAFADGYVAVLLPAYLIALGYGQFAVGVMSTVTLLGSALTTLAIGHFGHRYSIRTLILSAAMLMASTGFSFAVLTSLWPLLIVAFVGTLNPSSGDVSVFLPLEHTALASAASADSAASAFARYSFVGSIFAALGALATALPDWLAARSILPMVDALRLMFVVYGLLGLTVWVLYSRLPLATGEAAIPSSALGPSRGTVWRLAGLFSVDAFAGGLIVNSILALWLFDRFGISLAAAGAFFFWASLLSAASQLVAPVLGRRFGLLNTMVFTHIPSSLFLIAAAFAPTWQLALGLLLARSALSQMDVPARSAYVMSVVTPPERAAAASFTAVPRSLASAISPALSGAMLAAGALAAPLLVCGALKIVYDLSLYMAFRKVVPRA